MGRVRAGGCEEVSESVDPRTGTVQALGSHLYLVQGYVMSRAAAADLWEKLTEVLGENDVNADACGRLAVGSKNELPPRSFGCIKAALELYQTGRVSGTFNGVYVNQLREEIARCRKAITQEQTARQFLEQEFLAERAARSELEERLAAEKSNTEEWRDRTARRDQRISELKKLAATKRKAKP